MFRIATTSGLKADHGIKPMQREYGFTFCEFAWIKGSAVKRKSGLTGHTAAVEWYGQWLVWAVVTFKI
jgi:hypothetical protein